MVPDSAPTSRTPEWVRQVIDLLSSLVGLLGNRYAIGTAMVALGVAAGVLIFVFLFPGKPRIGVIDIPYTVISEDSTYVITEYLNYARRDDSIKAVVIKLTSPGGGAASSERLYMETRKLREEKPVVLVMNGLVASGGYMMAMGTSHSYVQSSSLVGNVGVVSFAGPLISPLPNENVIVTGPYKAEGSSRREWVGLLDQLKESFAQIVVTERGDKLRISKDELVQGRIYTGLDAVRLGLADEWGGNSEAFEKAAALAGISNYGLVDVNLEVLRKFVKDLEDILPPASANSDSSDSLALVSRDYTASESPFQGAGQVANDNTVRTEAIRGLTLYGRLGVNQENPLPDFPLEISQPNFYYLYIGNAP